MTLPTDDKARKALPIFDGCIMYFPDALLAVSEVSRIGNEQHNPGEPLHWARGKSMDQYNTAVRHLIDHRLGARYDSGGERHLAKAAWRILAALQLDIETEQREKIQTDFMAFGTGVGRVTSSGIEHVPLRDFRSTAEGACGSQTDAEWCADDLQRAINSVDDGAFPLHPDDVPLPIEIPLGFFSRGE